MAQEGREKGESSDAGREKGESSDAGREKGESSDARQTEHLPQDLTYEILSRCQVKPLMGFKTVCKTWSQFMEQPHFIRQHFDLKQGEGLFYFGICKTGCSCDPEPDVLQKDAFVCGCNGMVVKKNLATFGYVIENLSTHQERTVPPARRPRNDHVIFLVCIQSTWTYKLFSYTLDIDGTPLLQVLTLGADLEWRRKQFFLAEGEEIAGFACTGAFIHMIKLVGGADQEGGADQGKSAELVTFDMENERFTTTVLEQSLFPDWKLTYILNWNGSPALVKMVAGGLDLLIIEDYSITHRVAAKKLHVELPNDFRRAMPIIAHENNLWMHARNGRMLCYGLQSGRTFEIPDSPSGWYYDGTIYAGKASIETVPGMQSQQRP